MHHNVRYLVVLGVNGAWDGYNFVHAPLPRHEQQGGLGECTHKTGEGVLKQAKGDDRRLARWVHRRRSLTDRPRRVARRPGVGAWWHVCGVCRRADGTRKRHASKRDVMSNYHSRGIQ